MLRIASTRVRNQVVLSTMARSGMTVMNQTSSRFEQTRNNNSFMKAVKEQMKKDMEANPELKKAYEDLQRSKKEAPNTASADAAKERMEKIKQDAENMSASFGNAAKTVKFQWEKIRDDNKQAIEETPMLKSISDSFASLTGAMKTGASKIFSVTQKAAETLNKDEEEAKKRNEEWKRKRSAQRATEEAEEKAKSEMGEEYPEAPMQDGLVLRHETSWERFNSKMKDMPFMSRFNEAAPSIFGQTALGKALTKQKELDKNFSYPAFVEQVQHVVARRAVEAYLLEDTDFMKVHCVSSAAASFNNSIKERRMLKVHFDETILKWETPNLEGGMISEDPEDGEKPVFIWTIELQQVNCLRNDKDEIVEGAEDDIRAVTYAMAVRMHPDPTGDGVEFPYEISEFTMLSSKPVLM